MSHIPFPCLLSSRIGKQASYTMGMDTACIQHASKNRKNSSMLTTETKMEKVNGYSIWIN
jgi:hypothetical protein